MMKVSQVGLTTLVTNINKTALLGEKIMRLSRKQLRKIILKEMEDPTLPPEPVIPKSGQPFVKKPIMGPNNTPFYDYRDDDMSGQTGDDDMSGDGRPEEKLIKAIFHHMDNFLREFGSALAGYGGHLGGIQMGHIKKLGALTNKLRGCALGEVQEPWVVCAEPVLKLTMMIAQTIKTGMTDRYLRAPAGQGGLIELLQMSIQQASR